ncbi:MAG: sigma-70 family RNA polymerase sigma factor [Planctomycetes bacterium]|nr:sigma-70 family RNA polymerase sigma factor [Planctomycetota bacterium]
MTGDRDLALRARNGDRAALDALARRWEGPVFAVGYRFLGRPDEARDAAQETFRRMMQSFATYDDSRDFGPWILAIARNTSRTMLSDRGRMPVSLGSAPEPVAMPAPAAPDADRLRALLPRLDPVERAVLEMRTRHGMTHQEIAEALQIPPGTVRSHASRAIARLGAWMAEEER